MTNDADNMEHTETSDAPQASVTETHEPTPTPSPTGVPKRIGQYRIKRAIASGGMGTVYEAVQEKPRRTVAVKLMRAGIASRSALRRFEYESQLLARLRHNGIAQVYDAGTHRDGEVVVPYFAMEYIVGARPVTVYAKQKKLGTRERLKLFADVCEAVHHGHQKGIIHRDLKPSNILVDSSGQVKIIDFGVARSTDSDMAVTTLQTDVGQLIGTLQYMSPEQCAADPHDIDTRSDVYALGVILYEMLCERLPYDVKKSAIHEATRVIREEEPTRLCAHNKMLRGDLDWIVMKCLEKDRTRRYETANALAADINRHLSDEPVVAGPPSTGYRMRKFAKRNRAVVIAGSMVATALLLGIAGTTTGLLWALNQKERATSAERATQRELTRANEVKRLITEMLSSVNPAMARGADNRLLKGILDDTARRLTRGEIADELIAAELHNLVAEVYRDLGLWDESERHFSIAIEMRKRLLGEEHPNTLHSMREQFLLERYRWGRGAQNDWELRSRDLLEMRTRILGSEHPDTLTSLDDFAEWHAYFGNRDLVEPMLVKILETRRRVLGADHRDTLASIYHLGMLRDMQGQTAAAEQLCQEALARRKRVLGEDHPDTLVSTFRLARFYEKHGRYEEAESLRIKAVEGYKKTAGEQHPHTMLLQSELGSLYEKMHRYDDACAAYEAELQLRGDAQGLQHQRTWHTIRSLVNAYLKVGRDADALTLSRELLEYLPAEPTDAKASPNALYTVAWALTRDLEDLRDPVRAVDFAQRAATISQQRNKGPIPQYLDMLALAQHQAGDTASAIETEKRAISLLTESEYDASVRPAYETALRIYEAVMERQAGDTAANDSGIKGLNK